MTAGARLTRGVLVTATLGASADAAVSPENVVASLVHAGVGVRGFTVAPPDLEELFVSLTGEGFDVTEGTAAREERAVPRLTRKREVRAPASSGGTS